MKRCLIFQTILWIIQTWPLISSKLKSRGIQLVMRGAKMQWITGGAKAANKMLKKILPPNKKLSLFALNYFLEYAMFHINSRPIGLSTSDETVSPIDIIPVWSRLDPKTMAGAGKCLLSMMADFTKKWEELYLLTITQQNKWFSSNHELGKNDVVFIKDLKTERGTPRLAQIIKVDLDSGPG